MTFVPNEEPVFFPSQGKTNAGALKCLRPLWNQGIGGGFVRQRGNSFKETKKARNLFLAEHTVDFGKSGGELLIGGGESIRYDAAARV